MPGIERVTVYRRVVRCTHEASKRGDPYVSFELRAGADATPQELHRLETSILARAVQP